MILVRKVINNYEAHNERNVEQKNKIGNLELTFK